MCCGIEGLCTALTGGGVRGAMRRYIMVSDWKVRIGKGISYVGIGIVGVVRGWNVLFWRRLDGAGSWAGVRLLDQSLPGGFLV